MYALDPQTGAVKHRQQCYGPFNEKTGQPNMGPVTKKFAFKADICVGGKDRVYVRHQGFNSDLSQ